MYTYIRVYVHERTKIRDYSKVGCLYTALYLGPYMEDTWVHVYTYAYDTSTCMYNMGDVTYT